MTTTTTKTTKTTHTTSAEQPDTSTRSLKLQLANLRDELELFGWRPEDTSRYAHQALKALPVRAVIDLFRELVAEERSYYARHSRLADDQLDHTLITA